MDILASYGTPGSNSRSCQFAVRAPDPALPPCTTSFVARGDLDAYVAITEEVASTLRFRQGQEVEADLQSVVSSPACSVSCMRYASSAQRSCGAARSAAASEGKESTHSFPLPTYSAPGGLRQDRGRAAESLA